MAVKPTEITWVLDITIAYPQGKPIDLPTIITGLRSPCETFLFYRLYPSKMVRYYVFNNIYIYMYIQIFYFIHYKKTRRFHVNQSYCLNGYMIDG